MASILFGRVCSGLQPIEQEAYASGIWWRDSILADCSGGSGQAVQEKVESVVIKLVGHMRKESIVE